MLAEEYKAFLSENAASRDEQPNIYHEHEPGRRTAPCSESRLARLIAANIAKLPELVAAIIRCDAALTMASPKQKARSVAGPLVAHQAHSIKTRPEDSR